MSEANRIKVVQIITDSALGGGPKHVLGILKHLDQNVFDPYLVCPSGYLSVEGKLIKGVKVLNFKSNSKFDLRAFFDLKKIIHTIQSNVDPFAPMIIHSHGPRAGLFSALLKLPNVKKIYTEHRLDADYHLKNPLNDYFQKKILLKLSEKADLIVAVSSSVRKYLASNNSKLTSKIVIIPNAIEKNKVNEASKKVKINNKAPRIGTVGNLNVQKGHTYLIDAMAELVKKYPLATLEIVGEGEERKALEYKIKKLKLAHNITLLGSKSNVGNYLKRWDIFVLPSVAETFGIVLLEALQAGVPVVATKVGGVSDIIAQRKNGLLVEPRNLKAIVDGIVDVVEKPALSAKFKREGLEKVKEFYWDKVILKLEKAYKEVACQNS